VSRNEGELDDLATTSNLSTEYHKKNVSIQAFTMESEIFRTKFKLLLSSLLILFIWQPSAPFSQEIETVSLKTYKQLSIPVPNQMDLTKISPGKGYQVADSEFILQFYYDGNDIYGVILKRDKKVSIFMHWCFFRSCDESPYDIKLKIASAWTPPYDQTFFNAKLPEKLNYRFQGLKFYTTH
jgi:hypothetical protein